MFTVKELSRAVSGPSAEHLENLKRLLRYLKLSMHHEWKLTFDEPIKDVLVVPGVADASWASTTN